MMATSDLFNEKQKAAEQAIRDGKNVFISGPGGVGKSFVTQALRDELRNDTVFMAPTGIAALNIDGATFHSTFRFPLHVLTKFQQTHPDHNVEELFGLDSPVRRIWIDEISMTRSDHFVTMDQNLRRVTRKNKPFGGLQVIVMGDFYQLPPVVNKQDQQVFSKLYSSPYAFGNESWSECAFEYIELDEIMRQDDEEFIGHLQAVRQKSEGYEESLAFFNEIGNENALGLFDLTPVVMCSVNKAADLINNEEYEALEEVEETYHAKHWGKFDSLPAPKILNLKVGAKVMVTKNLVNHNAMNGEIGIYMGMSGDLAKIEKEADGVMVYIPIVKWEQKEYVIDKNTKTLQTNTVGVFEQYPIKYAWALTVHKCQGTSLDHALIHKGRGFFAHGQTYVALSRIRTPEGLGLLGGSLSPSDIIVDPAVSEFYKNGCVGIGLF